MPKVKVLMLECLLCHRKGFLLTGLRSHKCPRKLNSMQERQLLSQDQIERAIFHAKFGALSKEEFEIYMGSNWAAQNVYGPKGHLVTLKAVVDFLIEFKKQPTKLKILQAAIRRREKAAAKANHEAVKDLRGIAAGVA